MKPAALEPLQTIKTADWLLVMRFLKNFWLQPNQFFGKKHCRHQKVMQDHLGGWGPLGLVNTLVDGDFGG